MTSRVAVSAPPRRRLGDDARRAAPRRSLAAPRAIERLYLVLAMSILLSVPFLVGDQPQGEQSLNPVKALEAMSVQGDLHKQILLGCLYAGAAALLVAYNRWRTLRLLGAPLLMLIAWCFLSAMWSIEPEVTLRRSAALLGTVVLGTYIGLRFDLKDMLRLMSHVAAVVLIGSLVVAVALPLLGLDAEGRLRGLFSHKNALAGYAALALLMLAEPLYEKQYRSKLDALRYGCLLGISIGCLLLAHSAGIVPALMVGLPLLAFTRIARNADKAFLALLPVVACIVAIVITAMSYQAATIAELLGRDADVSGRTVIWNFSAAMFLERPWLGYGYNTFWEGFNSPGGAFWSISKLGAPHSHNGYLQLSLDAGAVGLLLFAAALVVLIGRLSWLVRHGGERPLGWVVGFVGFFLVINLAETRLWIGNQIDTVLFVYVVVYTNRMVRQIRVEQAGAWARGRARLRTTVSLPSGVKVS